MKAVHFWMLFRFGYIARLVSSVRLDDSLYRRALEPISRNDCLYCLLNIVTIAFEVQSEDMMMFDCTTLAFQEPDHLSDMTYPIDLDEDFVNANIDRLHFGDTLVCVHGGQAIRANEKTDSYILIPNGSEVELMENESFRAILSDYTVGTRSLLVVRVSTPSETVSYSTNQLAGAIFGVGPQSLTNSLSAQYRRCSIDQLNFVPATGFPQINNGILDISLSFSVSGQNIANLENALTQVVSNILGVSSLSRTFDHVMYCVPSGTYSGGGSDWLAYAYVQNYRSYMNNAWCYRLTALQHEIGHNIGFLHSSEGSFEYGDETGIMGTSSFETNGPIYCFNGNKNWLAGWYASKAVDLSNSLSSTWNGDLFAFVDYSSANASNGQYVLIKINDLFVQYNRARGFNAGTQEHPNKVTIVSGPDNTGNFRSFLLSALDQGQRFTRNGVTVEACSKSFGPPDYVRISVYRNGFISTCGSVVAPPPNVKPTSPPTRAPTPTPNTIPAPAPTKRPTMKPTRPPAENPVGDPPLTFAGFCSWGSCGDCEGDCLYDSDCAGDLRCYHRFGAEAVPGCSGKGISGYDYCYSLPKGLPELVWYGNWYCNWYGCDECQGHCYDDRDCVGNLRCSQRSAYEEVPGCAGQGVFGVNYCHRPDVTDDTPPVQTPSDPSTWVLSDIPYRCGVNELDARGNCKRSCNYQTDCVYPEICWIVYENYCGSKPAQPWCSPYHQMSVYSRCGRNEAEARERCGAPCYWSSDCALDELCWYVAPNFCEC